MIDRYTKFILTVIAGALLYLAAIFTPLPGLEAQTNSLTPGVSSGPTEVVVVGWRPGARETPLPVRIEQTQPLRIEGNVTTERSASGLADRVVLVGWEQGAVRDRAAPLRAFTDKAAMPVRVVQ